MPYAIHQLGYAIFGVGMTEEEAINNAKEWVDNPEKLEDEIKAPYDATHGDMVLEEITDRLFHSVNKYGGTICYKHGKNSMLDVC